MMIMMRMLLEGAHRARPPPLTARPGHATLAHMSPLLDVAILRALTPTATPSPLALAADDSTRAAETPDDAASSLAAPSGATVLIATPITASPRDDIADMLDRDDPAVDTIKQARCDDISRRIIREGGHISMAALAREMGTTAPTLKRLMSTALYRQTYNRISDELLGSIDERIADERLDVLTRGDTMQRRALTVIGECLEMVRAHKRAVDNGAVARPGMLKVGIEAAAEIRQLVTARAAAGANGAQVNINITRNQATVIQGAFRESGVDLSDVLGEAFTTSTQGATP